MPYGNYYRPDRLFLPQQQLLSFARDVPTPFFLYDEDGIRKTARTILGSFRWNEAHRAWFPIRVNAAPMVLLALREEGIGVLAQSVGELRIARELGFSGNEILFHTAAMTDAAASELSMSGAGVILDAPCQIEQLSQPLPAVCLLRFHPEKNRNSALFSANTDRHKAGMSREQAIAAATRLRELGAGSIGLHCHLASNAISENYYPAAASELFALAAGLRDELRIEISVCDLGGGLGLREPLPNLPHIGTLVREEYRRFFHNTMAPALYTELGRYVVGRHGLLISRVAEVRERTRRYAILDADSAELPAQRAPAHISMVGTCTRKDRLVYSVHGCTTDSTDRFSDRAMLPPLSPGDLIAIHCTGAYARPSCESYIYCLDGTIRRVGLS